MQILDKRGWPVTFFKGRPMINIVRFLLHCRKIKRGQFVYTPKVKNTDTNAYGKQNETFDEWLSRQAHNETMVHIESARELWERLKTNA